jgi:DNA-directed RNA polymerase subunit M/transcription elongation factor TFIIS
VKTWVSSEKRSVEEIKAFCIKCGILEDSIDPSTYRWETKIDHTNHRETIIIDRKQQLYELQKKLGKRTYGRACPNCKGFYFTPRRIVTRGDEAGKTFLHCLVCGHVFRRPIYIQPDNEINNKSIS